MEKSFLQKYGILLVLLLICTVLSFLSPVFLTAPNLINVVRQISINGILAIGMTFIIITGGIDLSVGSQVALTGAAVAGLLSSGVNMALAVIAGFAVGGLIGFVNGTIITKGGVPPFIVTLGMLTAARGTTLIYTGGRLIYNLGSAFRFFGAGYVGGVPVPVIILGIILIVSHFVAKHTVFGREVYAVGGNPEAAVYSGVNKNKRLVQVYTLMELLSAITGVVLTSRLGSSDPTAGTGFELDAIAAVVIGGTSMFGGEGAVTGTMIGALIIGVINNGLNLLNVSSYYQQVIKGVIVVGAVLMDGYARNKQKSLLRLVREDNVVEHGTKNKLEAKMTMKKTLVVLFTVLMLLLGTVNVGHVYAKDTLEIAVAFCTLNIPFFVEMENGVREAADEAQVRLVVTNAEDSAAKQLSQVEDLITRKPDLLLLAPVDSDVLVSAVEAAHKANIPVITIDRTVNSDKVLTFIGVDDVAGGRAAGEYVVQRLNGKGNVIMLEGVIGSSAQRDRAQGFEEVIGQYEGIKMLAKQTANFNRVEGMNVTENLLQAHPEIDAIFAQNDEMALGALRAIEAAQKQGDIIVVGFDADPEAKDAVRLGEMDATVEGSPYKLGLMGIEAALKYLNGEALPEQSYYHLNL